MFPKIVGITPAMPSGSGMIKAMQKYPNRFFDVGIAEQHAITFAAGLATEGFVPIINIYSTFLQRGFDQLIHDVALQKLPVIFCVDRAGLVGEDGPTHHGAFDISFLRCIPNLIISAPKDEVEFRNLLFTAVHEKKPFAIRYPKGNGFTEKYNLPMKKIEIGSVEILSSNSKTAIISTGIATQFALEAHKLSKNKPSIFHFPFIKPLNLESLDSIFESHAHIITIEDGSVAGGFGEAVTVYAKEYGFNGSIKQLGIPDNFVTHGDNSILYDICGYSPQKIAELLDT